MGEVVGGSELWTMPTPPSAEVLEMMRRVEERGFGAGHE